MDARKAVEPLREWMANVAPNIIGKASMAELSNVVDEVERRARWIEDGFERRVQSEVLGRFEEVKDALKEAYKETCASKREFNEEWREVEEEWPF